MLQLQNLNQILSLKYHQVLKQYLIKLSYYNYILIMKKLVFFILLVLVRRAASQLPLCTNAGCTSCDPYAEPLGGYCQCKPGYYMVVDPSIYCDICHTSCKTCSGPLSTNCIECADDFTFSAASCIEPYNSDVSTYIKAYSFEGFAIRTGWTLTSFSSTTYQCGSRTLLGGTVSSSTNKISVTISDMPAYYAIRVKANFFFLGGNTTTKYVNLKVGSASVVQIGGSDNSYSHDTCGGAFVMRAFDQTVDLTGASGSSLTVEISSSLHVNYGIRNVYILAYKCDSTCATCDGPSNDECITCSDGNRIATSTINNGTCLCNGNYYEEPYAHSCANPCPSVPVKYYGDNTTRLCVETCPTGYASEDNFKCVTDCPVTSSINSKKVFRSNTTKKCVVNCPAAEPYGYLDDRYCYATCPGTSRKCSTTEMRCVNVCPHTNLDSGIYEMYGLNDDCIAYCPNGHWGDPGSALCVTNCTNASWTYMDNSTGQNLCVPLCPAPNYFADPLDYCVQICESPLFGDPLHAQRKCVAQCTAPNWGLVGYNRKCVSKCPSGTWAEPDNRVCVETTVQCGSRYANDYLRQCVAAVNCPFGTYAENVTNHCIPYCPDGTYGHPTTRVCQLSCANPYFADDGINLCVSTCVTNGTFADVDSGRKCVTACNSSGGTKWADDSTKTCVSDCNQTVAAYLADNTTWSCVYDCPTTHVADYTTTAPKCVITCPSGYFADFTSGTRICVQKCSTYPPQFGDADGGLNLCVDVCATGTFGDPTGNRLCRTTCPTPYFAQNDDQRRCVLRCNATSYGLQKTCTTNAATCEFGYDRDCEEDPHDCPNNFFGDDSTNLCVNPCPISQATFGDPETKKCVRTCPDNPDYNSGSSGQPHTYYADSSIRQCVKECNASHSTPLFGNNNTRSCVPKCLDYESYAEDQTTYRICVARCLDDPQYRYANNFTKTCGLSISCPYQYYGHNTSQVCVEFCPDPEWAYEDASHKLCLDICPEGWVGDDSTSKRVCVEVCPTRPDRYADLNDNLCVDMCNETYYGEPVDRTCVDLCPDGYFSFEPTRRCLTSCPTGYFADDHPTVRKCFPTSAECVYNFGDPYLRECVDICTGPEPVDTFGSGDDCVSFCPNGTYADSHSASRLCVELCPPGVLNSVAAPNLYGDPTTHRCVARCVTPHTWADFQTRLCQPECSALPIPTYSENFDMTCVISLNCPTTPTITFGDSNTRKCVSFCSNLEWGDPNSRNCVDQCPNISTTTDRYFGDNSTGQPLCVLVCPEVPRMFGENLTNLCVEECPEDTFGDITGKRTCVVQCPLISTVYYYGQNFERICVKICMEGTWGLQSDRICVEDPVECVPQWADNSTNLCVTTCPVADGTFGDPETKTCVPVCPDGSYADDLTRTCVETCPEDNGIHDTFGNNQTNICEEVCTQPNGYADPQHANRLCVQQCSQSPAESFADPSTKMCVPRCPTHPSLFAETENFTCVSSCIAPYFADTHTRRCELACDTSTEYKLLSPERKCMTLCPSDPPLFGDSDSGFCESTCTNGQYRYTTLRICVDDCTTYSLLEYDFTCVKYCPVGFYANADGNCLDECDSGFGENTTTTCLATCITGFAHDKLCRAECPSGFYGYNHVCYDTCPSGTASNISNLCISQCDHETYNEGGVCVANCTAGTYADPNNHMCSGSCTGGLYADPTTDRCVESCAVDWYRDPSFFCKDACSPLRADNITLTCTSKCSNGSWGYLHECLEICPDLFYGYEPDRDCYNIANIPDTDLFADTVTQTWVAVCSYNPLRFGDRASHQCVEACSQADEYADPESRECETACTNSSYYLDETTKKCVLVCPQNYHANPSSGTCQVNCTHNKYDYGPSHICVDVCPRPYYGFHNDTEKVCVIQCPDGFFAEGDLCKDACTLPLYADSTTHRCVADCLDGTFAADDSKTCELTCDQFGEIADNSTNKCVDECPTEPDYYKEDGICVMHCSGDPGDLYADPTPGIRACVTLCEEGLWGDPVSGRCLDTCLPGYYRYNTTNECLKECPPGEFADNSTYNCEDTCPDPTFADSLTNRCERICTGNQLGEDNVCTDMCSEGLWGNPLTRECEGSCPDFDYTYAENNTNMCVRDCSTFPNQYADRTINVCVSACTLEFEYALTSPAICTPLCPEGLFMDNSTKLCQPDCDDGFAESTTRFCVERCFGSPESFAHTTSATCVSKCKTPELGNNLYADNSTNYCVAFDACSRAEDYYSDPISGNCVKFCPEGLYAENDTFTCTSYCADGFADNFTRRCVQVCPEAPEDTYGSPQHTCVKVCPDGMFAENSSQLCVNADECPTDNWSDNISKHCVARCPSVPLYFGYNATSTCVQTCPDSPELYGDKVSQTCVTACENLNGERRFADPISRTCVFLCPIEEGLYGDPTTGKCTSSCDSANHLRDNSTQRCTALCPSNPDYYAFIDDHRCVRTCPEEPTQLFASDQTDRLCVDDCTSYGTFADEIMNRCVEKCPEPYFADDSTHKCVLECPESEGYFADPHTRTCVSGCPTDDTVTDPEPLWISWGQDTDRSCVTRCPENYFAQNSSRECVDVCPPNEYADPIIQVCVAACTVRPGYYISSSTLRTCVTECPTQPTISHKYESNHSCVYMTGDTSGCPGSQFANPLTMACTTVCPHGYFKDLTTRFCVQRCSGGEFADPYDRTCKSGCTQSPNLFAYDVDDACVAYCPSPYFSENVTWTCTQSCPTMINTSITYKYTETRQCVVKCPYPYYAKLPSRQCILDCPTDYYAYDETRECLTDCPGLYFADDSTNRCVETCPSDPDYYGLDNVCGPTCPTPYFRDNSTRLCVEECPTTPLLFADSSTNTCVEMCPSDPNYFADNETKQCVLNCSDGTFAEVESRTCVDECPDELETYADPETGVCQPFCEDPYYRSNLTKQCLELCPNTPIKTYAQDNGRVCVQICEDGLFGNNQSRKCESDCTAMANAYEDETTNLCVTTCPIGYFAYDDTQQCLRQCLGGQFADSSTRKCVDDCPGTQRLYADPTTDTCVLQCPTGSYGDSQTWTCLPDCPDSSAGYRLEVSRTCVAECPQPYFAIVSQRTCVNNCGAGLFGDPVTRTCKECPDECLTCLALDTCLSCQDTLYLEYGRCITNCTINSEVANYANSLTMKCVVPLRCPSGTFARNDTKECSSTCPPQMYGNITTRSCQECPITCSSCINSTHCTDCIANAELSSSDSACYEHCNQTHQFEASGSCFETCPDGTYIDYTNVHCEACNAICLTCTGNSLNCTNCDGTFRLNNSCLTQCPSNYYAEGGQCHTCEPGVPACSNPLTFETKVIIEDYQQVVVIDFSEDVKVNGRVEDMLKLKLKMKRRMISVADLVNNGISFRAEVLPDGTIKLYLDPSVSLDNVEYSVSFRDTSGIQSASGGSLQQLESSVFIEDAETYPEGTKEDAPLVVAGKVLAYATLIITFFMLIFGLSPVYLLIEAIQFTSLFAYTEILPPNLFYFLKQMRLTRFVFMPNIFSSAYVEPSSYQPQIPQKVLDTEEYLSFALNGTGFFFFIIFYLFYALIVFAITSKVNSNRPLKNLFIKIWETRVKFGIINDFLWLFTTNTLVCAWMQYHYMENKAEIAMATIFMIFFLALICALFGYGVRKYRNRNQSEEDERIIENNYSQVFQGTKDEWYHKFLHFAYHLRRILFAAIVVATVSNQYLAGVFFLCIISLLGLFVLIIRPHKEHLRNFVHLAHEGFLGFLSGGIIYFLGMYNREEVSGAKITCGEVLTIVIIIHISLLCVWSIYKSYQYLKQLREEFMKTEFYVLYMDEEYDNALEKEISQLNEDEKGEVESIQVTQYASNEVGEQDEENQVIKLKIKRRVKKETLKKSSLREREEEGKRLNEKRNRQDYVKVDDKNKGYYELKPANRKAVEDEYEKIIFDDDTKFNRVVMEEEEEKKYQDDQQWVQVKQDERQEYIHRQEEQINDKDSEDGQEEFKPIQINKGQDNSKGKEEKDDDFDFLDDEDLEDKPKEDKNQNLKVSQEKEKMEKKMRSSFADFDESNFFAHEETERKKQQQKEREEEERRAEEKEKQRQKQEKIRKEREREQQKLRQQFEEEQQRKKKEEIQSKQKEAEEDYALNFDNYNEEPNQKGQEEIVEKKKEEQYNAFDFNDFLNDEPKEEKKKEENGPKGWSLEVEDLLGEKNENQEQKKKKEQSKKMHLMLFEDDDD